MKTKEQQYAECNLEMHDLLMNLAHAFHIACNGGGYEHIEKALEDVVAWQEQQK